jgi:class 3 adenylate cyclase
MPDGPATAADEHLERLLLESVVDEQEMWGRTLTEILHARRLGDGGWRAVLSQHHSAVRAEIARCEGTEVDTAGDGFFVRFDSPARALDCARAAREAVKRLGIDIRVGIHTGECEMQGRTLTGLAVHVAARIQGLAGPGDILLSSTVKEDIVVGSDARFEDRGQHALKGMPGECDFLARRLVLVYFSASFSASLTALIRQTTL